ncbi:DEAD/DEAH box helicase [Methanofollis fontis]|uniref:DNA/RNA helicase, superfamily II n=1 Tax=Methanofollis fontis TaxID=2052832 RepID=A0A483CPE1_9EURY|nr:helicase-related protein [Methanofollis fontis]TAJ43978.1 DNA/RNA helicase, superfamily II [Methanofollis fontis]
MGTNMIKPLFKVGDNVKIGNSEKIGTVNEVIIRNNSVGYRVTFDGTTKAIQEKFLSKIIDEEHEIIQSFYSDDIGDGDDFHLFQTWFRLKKPIEGNYYSYLASKTIFNPYQFKPLIKFVAPGSDGRLFIADEVGVGKTIETGIILIELLSRNRIDRKSPILIVCPHSLGPKWVKEMKQRFNLQFHLHDSKSLRNFFEYAKDGIIPDGMFWSIVSLPLLRNETHFKNLQVLNTSRETPLWSMVIIDESHHLRNASTLSYQIGCMLSNLTEMMVMLSATPLNLRDEDLFNQLNILNPSLFPDFQTFNAILSPVKSINRCRRLLVERSASVNSKILKEILEMKSGILGEAISNHPGVKKFEKRLLNGGLLNSEEIANFDRILGNLSPLDNSFTRTLKREALNHRVIREPINIPIKLTPEETKFHNGVIELSKKMYLERGGDPAALGFITNIPRRMASSCIPAMKEYLNWCIVNNSMLIDNSASEDDPDDDQGLNETSLTPDLRNCLIQLRSEAERIEGIDTKYDEFRKLIEKIQQTHVNPQIIVFSFFVRTLKYLQKRLAEDGYSVGLIYGDTPSYPDGNNQTRYQIMESFEKEEFEILLSSEVGGEGLDFQFCQTIINYDLPYNPMRIEQRIGRIDRFGQKGDKIFVASMYIQDSIDENIYSALYERINLVEESVGALEPILGTKLADLQNEIINGALSEEQLQRRIQEIEIAVEHAKLEMEKFEQNRIELMGEDKFAQIIQNLDSGTEFIQPIDALWLTKKCLHSWDKCDFNEIDESSGYITLSKQVVTQLEQYCRKPGSEGSFVELSRIMELNYPIEVVFNGTVAIQRNQAVFLPPCGFWIKFLLQELEKSEKIPRVFSISGESNNIGLSPGDYFVPFFEVMLEGFTTEITLSAVPVDVNNRTCVKCDYRTFSRLLAKNVLPSDHRVTSINPREAIETAQIDLESQIEIEMRELKDRNAYRIQSRINSIDKTTESRIIQLNSRIHEHYKKVISDGKEPSSKFIRLIESQKENVRKKREEFIQKIRNQDDLVMTLRLVAIASLRVNQ